MISLAEHHAYELEGLLDGDYTLWMQEQMDGLSDRDFVKVSTLIRRSKQRLTRKQQAGDLPTAAHRQRGRA